jgi:hypothetical protein
VTDQKSAKRRVRARMAKTGERYTAARRQLLAKSPTEVPESAGPAAAPEPAAPSAPGPDDAPPAASFRGNRAAGDAALVARTGRPWAEWLALLEAWGPAGRTHREIARWLNVEHDVDGWWAQELTVRYEMESGRRRPGERPDGFEVSASKTVGVPIERLFEAWVDEGTRGQWLRDVAIRVRTATPHRSARFDVGDGTERLAVNFLAKGDARSAVALQHQRLPDAETAARVKAAWRARMTELQRLLEG